jgi:pimeloyl-ACP methyl ester carboxylesterase
MYRFIMRLFGVLFLAVLGVIGILFFGPREKLPTELPKPSKALMDATDYDAFYANAERQVHGITPGVEKRIIWAGVAGAKTKQVVVYIHGFSATSEEIRPVPDNVANALGANLIFPRFRGHGRDGNALGAATGAEWLEDFVETMTIARAIGDEVILLTTSTGGTITVAASQYEGALDGVTGIAFISPNFGTQNKASFLGRLPYARVWAKWLTGGDVSWEPSNDLHAKFWTTSYPPHAIVPMMTHISAAENADYSAVTVPALFYFSMKDQVVVPELTQAVADRWGGPVTIEHPATGAGVDDNAHVIAGDIVSPANTGPAGASILKWVNGL